MRVVLIGDDGVGKSTFIVCLFKNRFVPDIEDVLPPLFFPRPKGPEVTVVDTSPSMPQQALLNEIRQAHCILLVFSDAYTRERVALFWMPFLRAAGVNKPIVLMQAQQDYIDDSQPFSDGDPANSGSSPSDEAHDVQMLMQEYKEIVGFIKTSAKQRANVSEAFYLCQQAVLYPLPPLFDAKDGCLKPLAKLALSRIFFLCDTELRGSLNKQVLQQLQKQVFHTKLSNEEIDVIARNIESLYPSRVAEMLVEPGIGEVELTLNGFLALCELYCQQGRQDTVWALLRHFHYTDSLSLDTTYLYPEISVPEHACVELSPDGYEFLVNLFTTFDTDNDGGLSSDELANVFRPTPGLPLFWTQSCVPLSTLRTDAGHISLQGWLAQWSMFVYLDHTNALACLAQLGYGSRLGSTDAPLKSALKVTKPARKRNPQSRMYRSSVIKDRQVFNCLVVGPPRAGKSSLLASFLNVSEDSATSMVVNTVELPGGTQCYLILRECDVETLLSNLETCDVICLCYDSSDPDSFAFIEKLLDLNPCLHYMPLVFVALKADLDRVEQRSALQPDDLCTVLGLSAPMHLSIYWQSSLSALFVRLVEVATHPGRGTIIVGNPNSKSSNRMLETTFLGAVVLGVSAFTYYWIKRTK